jgi:hypothetical protein
MVKSYHTPDRNDPDQSRGPRMTTPNGNATATLGNTDKRYVSATEAARQCGIPGRTVRHWATHGKVGTRQTAAGRLVLLRDVLDLATLTRPVAEPAATEDGHDLPSDASVSGLPVVDDTVGVPANSDGGSSRFAAILAGALATANEERTRFAAERQVMQAERDALREERIRLQSERDTLLERALRAEAAQARRRWWRPW